MHQLYHECTTDAIPLQSPTIQTDVPLCLTSFEGRASCLSITSANQQATNTYNRVPFCVASIGGFVSDSRDGVDRTAIESRRGLTFSHETAILPKGFFASYLGKGMHPDSHPGTISKYDGIRESVRSVVQTESRHHSVLAPREASRGVRGQGIPMRVITIQSMQPVESKVNRNQSTNPGLERPNPLKR